MTIRQKILKSLYPLLQTINGLFKGKGIFKAGTDAQRPNQSFYTLNALLSNGTTFNFNTLKGKKTLLVNIASNCGFTAQYTELEKLYQLHKHDLVILGFPSNDFKGQEPGSMQEIEQLCRVNFGVTFPLFQKVSVIDPGKHEVFKWLSDKNRNGWNEQAPTWNFCKYLVDENGSLKSVYLSHVSPLSKEVMADL